MGWDSTGRRGTEVMDRRVQIGKMESEGGKRRWESRGEGSARLERVSGR